MKLNKKTIFAWLFLLLVGFGLGKWAFPAPKERLPGVRYLIINADDFGASEAITQGIIRAWKEGIVTSTSAQVNLPGASERIRAAHAAYPGLPIGLHLDITEGKPVLPADQVPSLVDESGNFYSSDEITTHLTEISLALLRAGQAAKIHKKLQGMKEVIIGLDGMQPEKGNTCLYIVREMQTGLTLLAENLEDSAHPFLVERLFEPLKTLVQELNLKWKGVISDAQESIRLAVVTGLPGTPHQLCHFHCLRDAGALIFKNDRSLKTHLKSAFRGQLSRLEAAIQRLPETSFQRDVLSDYALAIHSTLLAGGIAPFDLAGIGIFDALGDIAASLQRCQKKGRTLSWVV
jgi:hypothetical protein